MNPNRLIANLALTILVVLTTVSAPARAVAQEPTVAAADCDGAEEWLDATWERHIRASEAIHRFIIEMQGGEPLDPEVLGSVGQDLDAFVRIQSASDPPPAADEFNEMLIERATLQAEAMEFFAQYATTGDEAIGEQGLDRTGRARRLGERMISVIEAFKTECTLAESEAFRFPACFGEEATRWFNFTSVRFTEFVYLLEAATDRLEIGLPIDEQIDNMERIQDEQVRSRAPDGAERYQSLVLEYFDTAIRIYRSIVSGDQVEADRLYRLLLELEPQVIEAEAEYSAPCITGGL